MTRRLLTVVAVGLMAGLGCFGGWLPAAVAQGSPDQEFDRALAAMESGDYGTAVQKLLALKKHFAADMTIRSKLIVAYARAGNRNARDRERAELLDLRARGAVPAIRDAEAFERDGFSVGRMKVAVIEYFDFVGERPVRYSFLVTTAADKDAERRITLGSYERSNRFLRQRGEIGKADRAFHLDEDTAEGHRTWGFFLKEPSYDEVKACVVEVLDGKAQPLSQSLTP